jgi:ubiquinone/menaquinone biosynthesis C-methylase UbiE
MPLRLFCARVVFNDTCQVACSPILKANIGEIGRVIMEQKLQIPQGRPRVVRSFPPGGSTAAPLNLEYRLGKIQKLGVLSGQWLDCGCADGSYTLGLTRFGAETAVGADVIEERILEAKKKANGSLGIEFVHIDTDGLPFPDAVFDGVLMNEVLEHVSDEKKVLQEIFRVLRPRGHLVVMSPNRWFPFEGHGGHIGTFQLPWPVPFLPWLPSSIGSRFMHARNYWPRELAELIQAQGFQIQAVNFVWPVFEIYPWLPTWLIRRYQSIIPTLEKFPLVRRFGVSVFVAAEKPLH